MRLLIELTMFLMIAVLAILAGALILWITGLPFNLEFKKSLAISMIGVFFVFPGAANLWIMFRGSDGPSLAQRAWPGVRGFGMLLCAVAFFIPTFADGKGLTQAVCLFIIGKVFWWGSVAVEDHLDAKRVREANLASEEVAPEANEAKQIDSENMKESI
jgi:hypothetical protein